MYFALVLRLMLLNCKTPHFAILSLSVEFRITEYYDPGPLQHASSQDTDLSCHADFVALCDHNPLTLYRMDVMLVA